MDLRAIEIFLSVCEAGGVTAAAGRLGISQAAVSQRMAQLEREFGVSLIDRQARPHKLTAAGDFLRQRAVGIVSEIHDLEHQLRRYQDFEIPELRIGIIESVAPALVPHLVPELRRFVGKLSVTSGIVGPLVPEMQKGNFDVIVTTESLDDVADTDRHTLLHEPFILLLPPGYSAPASIVDLADLARRLPFVGYGSGHRMSVAIDRQFERYGLELPRTLNFVSSAPIIDFVRQGAAWSIMTPLCLYSAGVRAGELVVAPLPEARLFRFVDLAAPKHHMGSIAGRVSMLCKNILTDRIIPSVRQYGAFADSDISCGGAPSAWMTSAA